MVEPDLPARLPVSELTGDVIFLLLHLPLQVGQQRLALLAHGEADCAEVVAGGLQGQGVQGQEAAHRLAVGQRAEENQRGSTTEP